MRNAGRLRKCYEDARRLLGGCGEPFDVVHTAEAHRQFWRPDDVRVLLLAESHVHTSAEECLPMHGVALHGPRGIPEKFVRLVYCLGYGEPNYVGHELPRNPGTWQYWKIFSSCVHPTGTPEFNAILKKHTPVDTHRVVKKINLLIRLKNMGVWLVDSSILALYAPSKPKANRQVRDRILQTCWDTYIGNVVATANPRQIIVIGKEVAEALGARVAEVSRGRHITIRQPQGLRSTDAIAHAYRQYNSACTEHCIRQPNQAL